MIPYKEKILTKEYWTEVIENRQLFYTNKKAFANVLATEFIEMLNGQSKAGIRQDNIMLSLPIDEQLEQAYLAGYKKRAQMSNLKYDFASELYAKSHFIKWKSKQGNKLKL